MADAPQVFDIEMTTFEARHPMVSTEVALASTGLRMASIRWADAFLDVHSTVISVENSYVFGSRPKRHVLLALIDLDHFEVPLVQTGDVEEARAVSEAGRLRRSRAIVDGDGHVPRDEGGQSRHQALRW